MLTPIILLALFICLGIGYRVAGNRQNSFRSFQERRCRTKFYDIKHKIDFCPTAAGLADIENEIIDLHEMYKGDVETVGQWCRQLTAMMEAKQKNLQTYKKQMA